MYRATYDYSLATTVTVKTGLPVICIYFLGSQFQYSTITAKIKILLTLPGTILDEGRQFLF